MAKKAFNKGDLVTYLASWDGKGTVTFRHAIVYACGTKQMVLTDAETGEEMGRHFAPENALEIVPEWPEHGRTYRRRTDEEATELAEEIGAKVVAEKTKRYNELLVRNTDAGEGYLSSIRKDLADLHEPEGISYAEALARLETPEGCAP